MRADGRPFEGAEAQRIACGPQVFLMLSTAEIVRQKPVVLANARAAGCGAVQSLAVIEGHKSGPHT
jgi:hypothetical protein